MKKRLLNFLGAVLAVWSVLEFLSMPALFVVIGLISGFGWKYYAWTVGGYVVVVILMELIAAVISKMVGRRIGTRLGRRFQTQQADETDSEE